MREATYLRALPPTTRQTREKITWRCTKNQKHTILPQTSTFLENNQIKTFLSLKTNPQNEFWKIWICSIFPALFLISSHSNNNFSEFSKYFWYLVKQVLVSCISYIKYVSINGQFNIYFFLIFILIILLVKAKIHLL